MRPVRGYACDVADDVRKCKHLVAANMWLPEHPPQRVTFAGRIHTMSRWHWRAAAQLVGRGRTGHRTADIHMWHLDDITTCRLQVFRDRRERGLALITLRDGDRGPSHINAAEKYRSRIWAEFFPEHTSPPTLIFNLLDPYLRFDGWPSVVAMDFGADGWFKCCRYAAAEELETLNHLGAEWDEGSGYARYVPPPPTHAVVLRRIMVNELPGSEPFRDMDGYLSTDWAAASAAALQATSYNTLPADLPVDIARAARSLWREPISLIREPGEPLRFMNGQHRAEAMRIQGVVETIAEEERPIDAEPLPGEFRVTREV